MQGPIYWEDQCVCYLVQIAGFGPAVCILPQASGAVLADFCKPSDSLMATDVTLHQFCNNVCKCCFFTRNTSPLQACTEKTVSLIHLQSDGTHLTLSEPHTIVMVHSLMPVIPPCVAAKFSSHITVFTIAHLCPLVGSQPRGLGVMHAFSWTSRCGSFLLCRHQNKALEHSPAG